MSDNIKVVVKVRPLISREIEEKLSYQWRVQSNTLYQLDSNGRDFGQSFTFDKVYNEDAETSNVYKDVAKPIVEAAIAGFNGTIFAYGQTSSGKTYTMTGTGASPGIIPLAVLNLFEIIKKIPDRDFLVRVSYIEIYNETVKDLLDVKKENIKIHETYEGSIKVDATERVTSSPEDVIGAMREGESNRQTGATNMNEKSSRSHSIFQITIESREHIEGEVQAGSVNVSQLNLVDLAGSERAGQTGATGLRFKEGTHINKSLSALALVIKQLSDDPNKYANYRDSKLTRILQNSLGGNAKTSIICAITPAALEETISTLQFATRAKAIKNKPEVNAVATDATMIQSLTKQLSRLQSQLESKKNLEVMLETKKNVEQDLQKQIANLQKLILNGFGQRSTIEHIGGTRRKLQQPRRVTISTLHSIDEDPVPAVPKFCTPSLKYNPMTIPNMSDFVPIQSTKLTSLPEEPARLVTTPPNDKKVNFSDEIIELDSDDDANSIPTCSPYHKCYTVSKTPPCILRKNLNKAEQNLQDIMELTEREKMYSPEVVELMEKLEKSTQLTMKLQDEVETLKKNSKDKDVDVDQLKCKIKKTEDEVNNAKLELENHRKQYDTKLTDWEVSYETLKRKSKLREDELLSLLEEQKQKKCEDIGKLPAIPVEKDSINMSLSMRGLFMDMSKDISLVNSDNESSIITSNEKESSEQMKDLVASLQDQLIVKCQTIVQLEANIESQKQSIEFLEQSSHELQALVDSLNNKLNYLDNEKKLLQSTVETLNDTVKNQKENLETAQNDIASYNSVIQELQIKLTNKDKLLNINISDSVLEAMISNEEKALANNENMKNIIHSFKIALDNRNTEITLLKSSIQESKDIQNNALTEDLKEKTIEIDVLNKEISNLKEQINENIITINKIMHEKSYLTCIEQDLTKQLEEIENQKSELVQLGNDNALLVENLKETNANLLRSMSEKNEKENEYMQLNTELQINKIELSAKIIQMEEEINNKNSLISTLSHLSDNKQENETEAKKAIDKLKTVVSILSGEVQEIPDLLGDSDNEFSALSCGFEKLKALATSSVSEKNAICIVNTQLTAEILELKNKFDDEKTALADKIQALIKSGEIHLKDIEALQKNNNQLLEEISKLRNDRDLKCDEYNILKEQNITLKEVENALRAELLDKQDIFKAKISDLENKHAMENSELQCKLEALEKSKENHLCNYSILKENNKQLSEELAKLKEINRQLVDETVELQSEKKIACDEFEMLVEQYDDLREIEKNLRSELLRAHDSLCLLNERQIQLQNCFEEVACKLEESNERLKHENNQLLAKEEALLYASASIEELKDKCTELTKNHKKFIDSAEVKDQHLENIISKICNVTNQLNIECDISSKDLNCNRYEYVLETLDKINIVISHNVKFNVNKKDSNMERPNFKNETETSLVENRDLEMKLDEIISAEILNENLMVSKEFMEQLKEELEAKAADIEIMKNKAKEWKKQFLHLDTTMKQQMQELQLENEQLKSQFLRVKNETQTQIDILSKEDVIDLDLEKSVTAPIVQTTNFKETLCPPSLLTICCNRIVEAIEPKQSDCTSVTTSSSESELQNIRSCSTCDHLSLELRILQQENTSLANVLEHLERANKELIMEQEKVREEIQYLLAPALELQKKIASHKTNLSILTATTYAENRSLKSQVTGLQHHHSRFHNVCQRDIPEFKRQLCELLVILKGDSSVSEVQNINLKRYSLPDVLESNSTITNFKNESTLDGDLLMLDTNVTLTTTGDNTLVGCDQTCLDITNTMFNEVSCQTHEHNQTEIRIDNMNVVEKDSQILQSLVALKEENYKLKVLIEKLSVVSKSRVDAQLSPMRLSSVDILCTKCQVENEVPPCETINEIQRLTQRLTDLQAEKEDIEKKYTDIFLEMPNTDALVCKFKTLEVEYNCRINELNNKLNAKNKELKMLQEENDTLSNQVMENISEADNLNKELGKVKIQNNDLVEKIQRLESRSEANSFECQQCEIKDKVVHSPQSKSSPHTKLNRSLSDSETSSRYNKICTLQSELYAGREDCKELTEDVATIKQHLNSSNISMDLDMSIGEGNVFTLAKDSFETTPQTTKCIMPEIQEERHLDMYSLDKIYCFNYYLEITGVDKELLSHDVKLIDIMRMFYNNLVSKHVNEVENLANKLKDYEETCSKLKIQINDMSCKHDIITKAMVKEEKNVSTVSKFISDMKSLINRINNEINDPDNSDCLVKIIDMFKQNFLSTLDHNFGTSSASVFEVILNKCQEDLINIEKHCVTLQHQNDNLSTQLNTANSCVTELKSKFVEKETECNLLKAQKEKILEISSAVTLDIVRKDQEINRSLNEACCKLLQQNLITSQLDSSLTASENIITLIDRVINQHSHKYQQLVHEKELLTFELKTMKTILDDKKKELIGLNTQVETLKDVNNNVNLDLTDKESKLQALNTAYEDLNKAYDIKVKENTSNLNAIDKLTEEITRLKETISSKESSVLSLTEKHSQMTDLLNSLKELQEQNEKLKSVNQMVINENESYGKDLEKSKETINQNNADMEKMTSDIIVLRDSIKEVTTMAESMKLQVQKLSKENVELKQSFEAKCKDCSRLEMNIKTHEKTAEVQSRIIMRLQKQKAEDDKMLSEKQVKLDEVSDKYNTLKNECEELKTAKESLEARVSELQDTADKPRLSIDVDTSTRRRRQSLHDSKRLLSDLEEHRNLEALFEARQKPDDLFMDVDADDNSGRSTPFGLKGRDSLLSRTDQSDKDEDHPSRPSSVLAARRRRQSIHDMHRGVARYTPSPHDLSRATDDLNNFKDSSGNRSDTSEVIQLREQLASCQQELEELKERFREVDEECETCAEYLKERDEQCMQLKKEKAALEKQVMTLNSFNPNSSQRAPTKPIVAHVAVNTDEDWANLHSVVVDRMSYDAEVEKNKRLMRTVEELRYKKQELRNTMAKMQKALEKNSTKEACKELEATKDELKSVKRELEELKQLYKELDEECDTCAQYLREREEQCRRLVEAKAALESKLSELQEDTHAHSLAMSHSTRKKRQTVHDMNRSPAVDQSDAATETGDDFLSQQLQHDNSSLKTTEDLQRDTKRLRMIVEKLTHQKISLEKQLQNAAATQPVYVATGSSIVQNQQLTDVMKENQRLKKINAKLVNICKKRGKSDTNRENEDPCEQG